MFLSFTFSSLEPLKDRSRTSHQKFRIFFNSNRKLLRRHNKIHVMVLMLVERITVEVLIENIQHRFQGHRSKLKFFDQVKELHGMTQML